MRVALGLLLLAACHAPPPSRVAEPVSVRTSTVAPRPLAAVAPVPVTPLRPVFGETMSCMMHAGPGRAYPLFLLGELESAWVPPSAIRRAVQGAVDVADGDGPSARKQVARQGVELLSQGDDRVALAALIVAEGVGSDVDRAQARLPVDDAAATGYDLAAIARERVLGGDRTEGMRLYRLIGRHNTRSTDRIGAAAVLGLADDVQREMQGASQEQGEAWLDAVVRSGAPVDRAVAALLAEMNASGSGSVSAYILTRATHLGRALEIEEVIEKVRRSVLASIPASQAAVASYPYVWALDDREQMELLAASDQEVKANYWARTAPLETLLARLDPRQVPLEQVVWIWARATDATLTEVEEEQLRRLACGDRVERAPATPPQSGVALTTGSAAAPGCAPTDTVVRLRGARGKLVGRAPSASSCLARVDRVGGRDVGILAHHSVGADGIRVRDYRLAFEACGQPVVTESFATEMNKSYELSEVVVHMSDDGQDLVAELHSERWNGVALRVRLPRCPAKPVVEVVQTRIY
ncbi:MAG TPA: hypothetical protein VGM90_37775 [Kofleriaceae bacterium]